MKTIIIIALSILFYSCNTQRYCKPPKGSKDYAVRQWVKERSDGYFIVTTIRGFGKRTTDLFECMPDSATLSRL